MRTITSLLLSTIIWSSLLVAGPGVTDAQSNAPPEVRCDGETRAAVNNFTGRIEYAITYNRSAQQVCAVAEGTGDRKGYFGYSVWIDGSRISSSDTKELTPGESFRSDQTITGGIDATRDNHTVEVYVYGEEFYFNFTQRVNTINEGGVPTPHFENLTVKRSGTKSGQPRIVLEVENEGIRTYVPVAEVRTFESDTRQLDKYINGTPGGRYSVRLSEDTDEVIVGTVRLYGGKFNPGTKFDRVSFVSYPNGTYETWEPAFGEIPTRREIEEGRIYYENESAREEYRGSDADPASEQTSNVGAVAVVAVVIGGLWCLRRRWSN